MKTEDIALAFFVATVLKKTGSIVYCVPGPLCEMCNTLIEQFRSSFHTLHESCKQEYQQIANIANKMRCSATLPLLKNKQRHEKQESRTAESRNFLETEILPVVQAYRASKTHLPERSATEKYYLEHIESSNSNFSLERIQQAEKEGKYFVIGLKRPQQGERVQINLTGKQLPGEKVAFVFNGNCSHQKMEKVLTEHAALMDPCANLSMTSFHSYRTHFKEIILGTCLRNNSHLWRAFMLLQEELLHCVEQFKLVDMPSAELHRAVYESTVKFVTNGDTLQVPTPRLGGVYLNCAHNRQIKTAAKQTIVSHSTMVSHLACFLENVLTIQHNIEDSTFDINLIRTSGYYHFDRKTEPRVQRLIRIMEGKQRHNIDVLFNIILHHLSHETFSNAVGFVNDATFDDMCEKIKCYIASRKPIFTGEFITSSIQKSKAIQHWQDIRTKTRLIENKVFQGVEPCTIQELYDSIMHHHKLEGVGDFNAFQIIMNAWCLGYVQQNDSSFIKLGPGSKNGLRICGREANAAGFLSFKKSMEDLLMQRYAAHLPFSKEVLRLSISTFEHMLCKFFKYARDQGFIPPKRSKKKEITLRSHLEHNDQWDVFLYRPQYNLHVRHFCPLSMVLPMGKFTASGGGFVYFRDLRLIVLAEPGDLVAANMLENTHYVLPVQGELGYLQRCSIIFYLHNKMLQELISMDADINGGQIFRALEDKLYQLNCIPVSQCQDSPERFQRKRKLEEPKQKKRKINK
jgi:hypothetical protein